jgi:hypothetical protein
MREGMNKKIMAFALVLLIIGSAFLSAASDVSGVSVSDVSNYRKNSTGYIRVKVRNDNDYPVTIYIANWPGGNPGMEDYASVTISKNSTSGWIELNSRWYTSVSKAHFHIAQG